jgi:hypothetical protein
MNSIKYFESISIPAPFEKIYKRLGYHRNITQVKATEKKEIENYIEEAVSLLQLQGAVRRCLIKEATPEKTILAGNIAFHSKKLSAFLEGSREILLMAATSGKGIVRAIKKDSEGENMTRGIVFDAAASEMVDGSLDWIMKYYSQELRRENKSLSEKRFSAGYGDFLIENQKTIYSCLKLSHLGITLSEAFILTPEKSVTAVAGISAAR